MFTDQARIVNMSAPCAVYWHRITPFLAAEVQTALHTVSSRTFPLGGTKLENVQHVLIKPFFFLEALSRNVLKMMSSEKKRIK